MTPKARRQHLLRRLERLARLERQADNIGKDILYKLVDRQKVLAFKKYIRNDAQAEDMLMRIQVKFIELFAQPANVEQALNRFSNLLDATNPIPDRIHNDLGKIADLLGIPTRAFLHGF